MIDFEMMDEVRGAAAPRPTGAWRLLLAGLVARTRTLRVELALQDDARLPALWTTKVEGLFGRALEQAHCTFLSPEGERQRPCAGCPLRAECAYPRLYDPGLILPGLPGGFERARPLRFLPVAWGPGSAIVDLQVLDPGVSLEEVEQAVWSMSGRWLGMLGVPVEVVSCEPRPSHDVSTPWRTPGAVAQFATLSSAQAQGKEMLPDPLTLVRASLRRAENLALQQGLDVPDTASRHALEDRAAEVLRVGRTDLREVSHARLRQVPLRGVVGRVELLGSNIAPAEAAALLDLIGLRGQLGIGRFTHFGGGHLRLWP